MIARIAIALIFLPLLALSTRAFAQSDMVNLYSARHYETDEALYEEFEEQTGITINRLEGGSDALIARLQREGRYSPADVLITVDAGRLWRAEQADLFQPVRSEVLDRRIPSYLRHPDGLWFGFSTRARMIFARRGADVPVISTYADLASERFKGRVCMRSSGNIYNLSLMASLVHHQGQEAALSWARAVVGNFARAPQGGDIDQIRAVAAGQCDVTLANSYYFARLLRSGAASAAAVVQAVQPIFPNQASRGTHVNISGAGVVRHAPNRANAVTFLEYLASDAAQRYFASGNNEYPAAQSVAAGEVLDQLGTFEADTLNMAILGENQADAQKLYDRAGWR